jgi:nitrate/TMAO reductase-like tetraheme cytochrome c subunit
MRKSLAGVLLVSGLAVFGRLDGQTRPSPNAACLACHGSAAVLPDKLKVNEENFAASVHAGLGCTDCHAMTAAGRAAAPGEPPHPKTLPPPDCTAACHRQATPSEPGLSPLAYRDSVHGRAFLERGVKEVAKCWDCHGQHNIRAVADPASSVNRKNIPLTCSGCHEDMSVVIKYNIHREQPYHEYMRSVHGKALFEKGLVRYAAVCTDCHGVHDIKGVGEPHLMAKQPQTCGRCHELIFDDYKDSIHGAQALAGNVDSPLCVDCHGEHDIASPEAEGAPTSRRRIQDTCSSCHARPEIMKKYGVPADRISTFIESQHGIAVGYGYRAAANCTSCHGVHDIRPASDPRSRVNPARLRSTCGQVGCHPNMPAAIADAKIHIGPGQKASAALYYIQKILLILVAVALAITVIWFVPGFIRKTRLLKSKK